MSDPQPAPKRISRWAACRVVAFVLAGLIVLDAVVAANSQRWRDYDPDPYRERLEACHNQPWDMVVVGGSPVTYGVDPAVLSGVCWHGQPLDHVYNLGLPLATAAEVRLAVEYGLPKAPPRLLIYGVSATDFNDDRVEPHGPRQLMEAGDVARWSYDRPKDAVWCMRQYAEQHAENLWRLYAYRNGVRLWAADQAEHLCPGICSEAAAEARAGLTCSAALRTRCGFQPTSTGPDARLDCLKAAGKIDPTFPFMEHYRLDGRLRPLHLLLDAAARRGVAVVLVDVPVPADLDGRLYPREYAAYRAALAAAAQERGVRLLSASSEAVGLSDADFADLIHLNCNGAARFSAWLRRELEKDETGGTP